MAQPDRGGHETVDSEFRLCGVEIPAPAELMDSTKFRKLVIAACWGMLLPPRSFCGSSLSGPWGLLAPIRSAGNSAKTLVPYRNHLRCMIVLAIALHNAIVGSSKALCRHRPSNGEAVRGSCSTNCLTFATSAATSPWKPLQP